MTGTILTLNSGSSSVKFALFAADLEGRPLISGKIEAIGTRPVFRARAADGTGLAGWGALEPAARHEPLIARLLDWIATQDAPAPMVAVHRVVHGGVDYAAPARLTPEVIATLETLTPLAPLHQPHNLAGIRAVAAAAPELPQIACFDTAFHRTQPRLAQIFALPRALTEAGIIRYGFHGLSYDYIASSLPGHLGTRAEGRVIVAHLGNGASLCAMKNRQSMATTMGFTALHGLMMGQRCGTLDCGVVLHLQQTLGMSVDEVQRLLYEQSGLLGVSGLSNDMRTLLASPDPRAREAVDLFCRSAASELAALVVALGGLDAIVFTAGIGENAPEVRRRICAHLGWLGVVLDDAANAAGGPSIGAPDAPVSVHIIPTDEERVLARAARALIHS